MTTTEPERLHLAQSLNVLAAGMIAGCTEVTATYPLDLIKTRQQLATTPKSMGTIVKDLLVYEDPLAFYRGLPAAMTGEIMKRLSKYFLNVALLPFYVTRDTDIFKLMAYAGLLGGLETLLTTPFENVKIKMQSPTLLDSMLQKTPILGPKSSVCLRYSSTLSCVNHVMTHEGLRGLYRGLSAHAWRNVIFGASYFSTTRIFTDFLQNPTASRQDKILTTMLSGFIGGATASCLSMPFDTVKTRIQNYRYGIIPSHNWEGFVFPTLFNISASEGPKALFKGLNAKVARLALGGSVMALIYDVALEQLQSGRPNGQKVVL